MAPGEGQATKKKKAKKEEKKKEKKSFKIWKEGDLFPLFKKCKPPPKKKSLMGWQEPEIYYLSPLSIGPRIKTVKCTTECLKIKTQTKTVKLFSINLISYFFLFRDRGTTGNHQCFFQLIKIEREGDLGEKEARPKKNIDLDIYLYI